MSFAMARKKRSALYLSVAGLLIMACAVSGVSVRDPDGLGIRVGMIMITAGLSLWLPWQAVLVAALAVWFGPNYVRTMTQETSLFDTPMLLELPGVLGLAGFTVIGRFALRRLENENIIIGATSEEYSGLDPQTGVYEEYLLRPAIEVEIARSRRFNRQFAIVLVGVDELRQRFDYRDQEAWAASFTATALLLRSTRARIDRAYRYGPTGFALMLPESGEREVVGLIRRLRSVARTSRPAEGEPGGPLPIHFGATFYPNAATTMEDLLRRAEVAMRIADKNSNRMQLDGAEAPGLPPPETLRRDEESATAADDDVERAIAAALEALRGDAAAAPATAEDEAPALVGETAHASYEEPEPAAAAAMAEQLIEEIEPLETSQPSQEPIALPVAAWGQTGIPEDEGLPQAAGIAAEDLPASWESEPAAYPEPIPFPIAADWRRESELEPARDEAGAQLVPTPADDGALSAVAELAQTSEEHAAAIANWSHSQWERETIDEMPGETFKDEQAAVELLPATGSEEPPAVPTAAVSVVERPVAIRSPEKEKEDAGDQDLAAVAEADAKIVDLMKHLDETLAMIKSLRTGTGS